MLAAKLPSASRLTTVKPVFRLFVDKPSKRSAFKFETFVCDATTNGAVPVDTFDTNCGAVTLALAKTCAVPKLPTLALPVIFA